MSTKKKTGEKKDEDLGPLLNATKSVSMGETNQREAARSFSVDRSKLQRQLKLFKEEFEDISTVSDDILMERLKTHLQRLPSNMVSFLST